MAAIGSIKCHRVGTASSVDFYRERRRSNFTERQFLADGGEMGRR